MHKKKMRTNFKINKHKLADEQCLSGNVLYSYIPEVRSSRGLPLILVLNSDFYYMSCRKLLYSTI